MWKELVCKIKGHQWERIKRPKKEKEYKSRFDGSETTVMKNLKKLFKEPRLRCTRCGKER